MSDEQTTQTQSEPAPEETKSEPQGETQTIDWKTESRKWEKRAKENSAAAKELQQLKEAQMSELEREKHRREKAETRLAEMETATKLAEAAKAAAKEYKVPEDLIRGSNPEEIEAHAKALHEYMKHSRGPVLDWQGVDEPVKQASSKVDALEQAFSAFL